MRIALYEPDIAQNTGTILRLAACLGLAVDIIGPAGFPSSDRALRRSGMDYLDHVEVTRHLSWDAFRTWQVRERSRRRRLILLTTKASTSYLDFHFAVDDILLLGRESAGVPDHVHNAADARLKIPMREGMRSLNVAVACAMVVGEMVRQVG